MNDEPVTGSSDLRNKVGLLRVGDAVNLTVIREGEPMTIDLAVGETGKLALGGGSQVPQLAGVVLGPLTASSPLYGKVEGVLVMQVEEDSQAWDAGLREGDVIVEVNRHPVKEPDDVLRAVEGSLPPLLLNVRRADGALFILIR